MKAYVSPSGAVALWPGAIPSSYDGWFVDVAEDELPQPGEGQQVIPGALVVVRDGSGVPISVRQTWSVIDKPPTPIGPVGKLVLKRRLGDEWPGVRDAIAANPDAQEDWSLAVEIDPSEPRTAGMLAMLRSTGLITKTNEELFAL